MRRGELLPYRLRPPQELGSQEVEISITHCGICHSDIHLISNDWGISLFPSFRAMKSSVRKVAAIGQ